MIRAVFDTNLLVSAFLMRHHPGGVSTELLRFVHDGAVELYLSPEIIQETAGTLARSGRAQARYRYTPAQAMQYCADLFTVATIITNPTPMVGAVPRDPDDDKIVACSISAKPALSPRKRNTWCRAIKIYSPSAAMVRSR